MANEMFLFAFEKVDVVLQSYRIYITQGWVSVVGILSLALNSSIR